MESCIFCVEKHLAKAHVYYGEARSGYAGRFAMMLGEMAAAEEESIDGYPIVASMIRMARKSLEKTRKHSEVSWEMMLQKVEAEANKADPSTRKMPEEPAKVAKIPTPQKGSAVSNPASRISAKPPCKSCKDRAEESLRKIEEQSAGAPMLIIATAIADWSSSYSLTSVVKEQAQAAAAAGFLVEVLGMVGMSRTNLPRTPGIRWAGLIPRCEWKDDQPNDEDAEAIQAALVGHINACRSKHITVITHDWLLISSYVSLAKAMHQIGKSTKRVTWYHQIHSSLGARPAAEGAVWRSTVPEGHHLLLINHDDIRRAQDYYQVDQDRIQVLPNSRDIQSLVRFTPRVQQILDQCPLHAADVVQIFPLSTPRAEAKGLDKVVQVFGEMKRQGATVRLLVVNAHANGEGPQAVKGRIQDLATKAGLTAQDMAWTSDLVPDQGAVGLQQGEVFSLMQLANVFCFPSTSEAAGLVMMEAALAGNLLVLNTSLPVLQEYITHQNALWAQWGSIRDSAVDDEVEGLAGRILTTLGTDLANKAKRRILARYGVDALSQRLRELFWVSAERSIQERI